MKIMILNNSGNVGKSFLARELFYFNMKNSCDDVALIEIETHNSASAKFGIETTKISGKELNTLFKQILINDCAVIDVGASNIVALFEELSKNDAGNIIEEIDYFIVPVNSKSKIQDDSLKILLALNALNIPKEKIKVIFNAVDNIKKMNTFIPKAKQIVDINENLVIPDFQYLNEIEKMSITTNQLANSEKNYKALAKEAYKSGDMEKGDKYADLSLMQGSSKTINNKLQEMFEYFKSNIKEKKC